MATLRNYISASLIAVYTGISADAINNETLNQSEEDIDSYVGPQTRALCEEYLGRMSAVAGNTFTLESDHQNKFYDDFFTFSVVQIVGGVGIGQIKRITASTYAGVVTVDGWDTTPNTTSIYKIYQLGKFPTINEVFIDTDNQPNKYYKHIMNEVARAVAAQYQYRVNMGESFFSTGKSNLQSESFGDYSYTRANGSSGLSSLIAPKAKEYLRGIMNRKGTILT